MNERAQFRQVLAQLASKTQSKMPALNGRVAKACTLVLEGEVSLQTDTTAHVGSLSDPSKSYQLTQGTCDCRDWPHAPDHLCCHRLAVGFTRKIAELLPPAIAGTAPLVPLLPAAPAAPLPEAACSVNVRLTIAGRDCQVTLRGHDDAAVLARLQAVLAQYPPTPAAPAAQGWCAIHNTAMRLHKGKEGKQDWYSHQTDDGQWCKAR